MLTTVEKVLFLKSTDLFRAIAGEELAPVAELAEEVEHLPGSVVFREGDAGDALYIIVEGAVRVHRGELVLERFHGRECFGELSVIDSEPRSATVTAEADTTLLRLSRDNFREIVGERPELTLGIMRVLSRRLRNQTSR